MSVFDDILSSRNAYLSSGLRAVNEGGICVVPESVSAPGSDADL